MNAAVDNRNLPLAWIALAAGIVPFTIVHLCYAISVAEGRLPGCVPYFSGCTSISATGRHGWSYFLFKAGMIPAAVIAAFYWALCREWLVAAGRPEGPVLRALVWLGVTSAAFLVLYTVFLGSKGDFYDLMRRFGVTIYFAFSALAQMLLLREVLEMRRQDGLAIPAWITRGKLLIAAALLTAGLVSVPVGNFAPDKDRVMNAIEWIFAAMSSSYYVLTWFAWKATGFRARFTTSGA
jgi:hypothetical protein